MAARWKHCAVAWQVRSGAEGVVQWGVVGSGEARRGLAWLVEVRFGAVRLGRGYGLAGKVCRGMVRQGLLRLRFGRCGDVRSGLLWQV